MSAPLNTKTARELVEAYQSIYASSVEKEMVDQEVDINEGAASMMSGSNTERQKQINKSGGRDTGLTAKIGTAVRNWLNPPRSQSADPVVRRGGSYTGPGGAPKFPSNSSTSQPSTSTTSSSQGSSTPQPAAKPAAKPSDGAERRTPTTAELRAAQAARAAGKSEKDVVKAGIAAGKPKVTGVGPVKSGTAYASSLKSTPKPEKKSRLDTALSGIGKWNEEVSPYDMVLDYLLSGGHVESVEEAHYVMLEMDQGTIQGICEGCIGEGLTGERYKEALKKGKQYSRRVSEDPAKRATRGGRGGESDFGAGDRGTGNKSRRRRGLPVGDED